MANEEQLAILKQGAGIWRKWRKENPDANIDLSGADLHQANLFRAMLNKANLSDVNFREANLKEAYLAEANLNHANLSEANLRDATLLLANLRGANLTEADLTEADLQAADLSEANLSFTNLTAAKLEGTIFSSARISFTYFINVDLSEVIGLEEIDHFGLSTIDAGTFYSTWGNIPEAFLRGCGLSDWEIEQAKLFKLNLSNEEINKILYKIYDLRATQALQVSPLFISYSHSDRTFVDKIEKQLNAKGIRFWRDIHDMKAGRMETQIDRAIRQNPTVLLVLSEHSLSSDWVEHEVRTARGLEKEMGRDVLCPVALDDSWKSSHWPKRVMEQIMEYNILDFSAWEDDRQFEGMFRKLIDGLELFYKG